MHRVLTDYFNQDVFLALGITDIDDKIIARAQLTHSQIPDANERCRTLASFFETDFIQDMNTLNVRPPAVYLRVSEHMDEIVEFIQVLLDRGFAYTAQGDVYFDTRTLTQRGKSYPKMRSSMGAEDDEPADANGTKKKRAADFVLWKGSEEQKEGQPSWEAPWGRGRPGWHIECSTACNVTFGQQLDLHTGGIDLQFPHHSNEIAQSEAHGLALQQQLTENEEGPKVKSEEASCDASCTTAHEVAGLGAGLESSWCRYFAHTGHLHISGRKMSKSLKNFITIKDFLGKHSPEHMRMFCLNHKYNSNIELTDKSLDQADRLLERWNEFTAEMQEVAAPGTYEGNDTQRWTAEDRALHALFLQVQANVRTALSDDFDTPSALKELLSLMSAANQAARQDQPRRVLLQTVAGYVERMFVCFGFTPQRHLQTGSAGEEGTVSTEDAMRAFVGFRDEVRTSALNIMKTKGEPVDVAKAGKSAAGDVLAACDRARDETFPTLGFTLQDKKEGARLRILRADNSKDQNQGN